MSASVRRTGITLAVMLAASIPAVGPRAAAQEASPAVATAGGYLPSVDVPAPFFWDGQANRRAGAQASRIELDDPGRAEDTSAWYHLAYVTPGDRLQVYDHTPPTTHGPHSRIARSQNLAWQVATDLLAGGRSTVRPGEMPGWARVRTGVADGSSGGLIFTLADLDLLTPGRLAGDLRVAGTGAIGSDGTVMAVRLVDAKLAAARVARADVFFAPEIPTGAGTVTMARPGRGPITAGQTIGHWLDTAGYERAGRIAATRPNGTALVPVVDVRQALAWLCGRTGRATTCDLARATAATPAGVARPLNAPTATANASPWRARQGVR
jgi:hypothetical protein